MAPQRPPRRGNQPARGPQNKSNRPPDRKGSPPRPHSATKRPASASSTTKRPASTTKRPGASSRPRGPRPASLPGEDRLQKILAHAGVGSRRACEELILQGRVTVNGEVVRELATKVDPAKTTVALDGQKVQLERPVYFAVFKPKGYVSTNNDPSGRPLVLDLLPQIPQRVYTVGRLDEMSIGLMILTNDGELANKLAHPRFGVEKLYRVIVAGIPTQDVLKQLTDGIWLAEGKVRAKSVRAVARKGEATILEMVLAEGKNREVRRMLAKLGHKVMMLTRVAVGPITIKGLTAGQFRPLTGREVDLLRRVAAGEPVPMPWTMDRKSARPLPDRPRRGASDGPRGAGDRPAGGPRGAGDRPAYAPRHAESRAPHARPGGPGGYRPNPGEAPRYPGPRPGENGPPRRPNEYRSDQQQGGPPRRPGEYRSNQDQGGPPPRGSAGYRPGSGGPPRRFEGPGGRPNENGPPRRPAEYRPNQQQGGPPGRSGEHRSNQQHDGPPRRPGEYRSNQQQGGPPAGPAGYRPGPGGPPRRFDGPGGRPPGPGNAPPGDRRPGAGRPEAIEGGQPPRPQGRGDTRPSHQRPGDDRRPSSRPPMPARRPGPSSGEAPQRKVIGMGYQAATPPPAQPAQDDRPRPRMRPPSGKRPAPRPPSGHRPMPKRRRGGDEPSE